MWLPIQTGSGFQTLGDTHIPKHEYSSPPPGDSFLIKLKIAAVLRYVSSFSKRVQAHNKPRLLFVYGLFRWNPGNYLGSFMSPYDLYAQACTLQLEFVFQGICWSEKDNSQPDLKKKQKQLLSHGLASPVVQMFYARSDLPANSWSSILRNMNTGQSAEKTRVSHNKWNLKLLWSNNWAINLALETRNASFTFKNLHVLCKIFYFPYPFKPMWWISGTQWNQRLFKISEVSIFDLGDVPSY